MYYSFLGFLILVNALEAGPALSGQFAQRVFSVRKKKKNSNTENSVMTDLEISNLNFISYLNMNYAFSPISIAGHIARY